MDDHSTLEVNGGHSLNPSSSNALDIYPLSCYYFGSRDSGSLKSETVADRLLRMKAKYVSISVMVYSFLYVSISVMDYSFLLFLWIYLFYVLVFWDFSYAAYGMRNCVAAVIVVSIFLPII